LRDRSPQTIWDTALGQLELQVTRPNYETWLRNTAGLRLEGNRFIVGVPSDFTLEWLRSRMSSLISRIVSDLLNGPVEVSFEVLGLHPPAPAPAANGQRPPAPQASPLDLDSRLTFDSFTALSSNRVAYRAAKRVAGGDGSYNPLVLFGPPGLGKTHLLHAIGHAAARGGRAVVALTGESFVDRFTKGVRAGQPDSFRELFHSCELLLLDDLTFLATRSASQEQFFHIADALHARGGQLVATTEVVPDNIQGLSARLRSRLQAGLCVELRPLSSNERLDVLRAKAARLSPPVSDDLLRLVAAEGYSTVRELEGALNRLSAYADLSHEPVSADTLSQALKPFTAPPLSTHTVIQTVARHFGLTPAQLAGPSRARDVTYARHIAMYLLHHRLSQSLTAVGHLLGGRDHSTVLSGCRRIEREAKSLPETQAALEQIQAFLHESAA
jgi:chromosomal replication initiator protein